MKATENSFRELEPSEVFDTVAPWRMLRREHGVRFDTRQPIPTLYAKCHRPNHALLAAQGLVFVVDGYPGLAEFAKTILDHAGFPACAFHDRVTAWHACAFALTPPHLLIVDDSEADLSAAELVRLCKNINPHLKVLVVHNHSASSDIRDVDFADAVVCQPYCGPLLVQEVHRLCPPPPRLSLDANAGR